MDQSMQLGSFYKKLLTYLFRSYKLRYSEIMEIKSCILHVYFILLIKMQLIVNYNRSALFIYALYKNNYKINISFY